ncbi:hypothetical protein [Sphaerisporangium fuscum]|uniref:hypothetical protein n=1 Tax=Sphaerisporangium fuscum TaxID=2835868 RepID=UPI001BDCDFB0|nr:hypothetical protein [Sphaerisporangium fuscum]
MSITVSRRVLAVTTASLFLSLSAAACGGSGDKAVCNDALQALRDYSSQVASTAGDFDKFNQASADLGAKLKDLSGKADGDLKSTLSDMASSWGSLKVDAKNPGAAAGDLQKAANEAAAASTKLGTACA